MDGKKAAEPAEPMRGPPPLQIVVEFQMRYTVRTETSPMVPSHFRGKQHRLPSLRAVLSSMATRMAAVFPVALSMENRL